MFHKHIRLTRGSIRLAPLALILAVSTAPAALVNPVPFTPSVPTLPGGPIGFAYAGNKFVGSVLDNGTGTGLLYSTDTSGNYQGLFGPGVTLNPNFGSEHYVSSSVGLGGFPLRDVYVASGNNVHHLSNTGADLGLVVTGSSGGLNGDVRGITFDTVGTFGYQMIVTTHTGYVYTINNAGNPFQIGFTNEDTEGLDIAPIGSGAHWGGLDGALFIASEGSGTIRAIKPGSFAMTTVATNVSHAEQLDFVPLNLGAGGTLEGMYSANYALNVLKAPASDFTTMIGDIIVTDEINRNIYDITAPNTFTTVGLFPNQPEDGLFVTAAIIAPEPASLALLGIGGLLLLGRRRGTQIIGRRE